MEVNLRTLVGWVLEHCFVFFLVWVLNHMMLLALCSQITPRGAQGTIWGAG